METLRGRQLEVMTKPKLLRASQFGFPDYPAPVVRTVNDDSDCDFSSSDGLPLEVVDEGIYERPHPDHRNGRQVRHDAVVPVRHRQPKCLEPTCSKSKYGRRMIPVRIVTVCENGHSTTCPSGFYRTRSLTQYRRCCWHPPDPGRMTYHLAKANLGRVSV